MIPNEQLNPLAPPATFVGREKRMGDGLLAYEIGGIAIGDASQGINLQQWYGRVVPIDGQQVFQLSSDGDTWTTIISRSGNVTEMDFAFDQNMVPFITWVEDGVTRIYWYDPNVSSMTITNLGDQLVNPRCCMDDKRDLQLVNSDIILAYIRAGGLYYRQQRDRYQVERLLQAGLAGGSRLVCVGMSTALRLQFRLVP